MSVTTLKRASSDPSGNLGICGLTFQTRRQNNQSSLRHSACRNDSLFILLASKG
jgi:hypothetical protein